MSALRDLLSVALTEIRKDRHMGRRERDVHAQVIRATTSLHIERLLALLDVERAEAEIGELRKMGKPVYATLQERLLERAVTALAIAESNINMAVPQTTGEPELVPASEPPVEGTRTVLVGLVGGLASHEHRS